MHHKGSSSEAKDKIGGPGAHGGRLKSGRARRTEAVAILQLEARNQRRNGLWKRDIHAKIGKEGKAAESGLMHGTIKERVRDGDTGEGKDTGKARSRVTD